MRRLALAYICQPVASWRRLEAHWTLWADLRALPSAGRSNDIRMLMIPMTTSSSTSVNARPKRRIRASLLPFASDTISFAGMGMVHERLSFAADAAAADVAGGQ